MKRKVFLVCLASILALSAICCLIVTAMDTCSKRPIQGKLSFDTQQLPLEDYPAGVFIIKWKPVLTVC